MKKKAELIVKSGLDGIVLFLLFYCLRKEEVEQEEEGPNYRYCK